MRKTQIRHPLSELRRSLEEVFPKACFLPGLTVGQNQRVFSIKLGRGEAAIGIQIDHEAMDWPRDQRRCDALFVCSVPDFNAPIIVLVELKGGHVEKALDQIEESVTALCRRETAVADVHNRKIVDELKKLGKTDHKGNVLGIIVSKKSIPIDPQRTKKYRKKGIVLWPKTGMFRGVSCRQLAEELFRLK